MKKKLLIIGAGGHGKVIADTAIKMNKWSEIQFLDDNPKDNKPLGFPVIGKVLDAELLVDQYEMVIGIGNNNIRKKLQERLIQLGATFPVIIHPMVTLGSDVTIHAGSVLMAGVIINCSTTIGKGCIINTGATVDHDNIIEDFVHLSPGVHLSGLVHIGNSSWLGVGSVVSNNVSVTKECNIGAGAVVIRDIRESGTYVGVPARKVGEQ